LENSTLISGTVPEVVADLKRQLSGDLVVLGSGVLLQSLMSHGPVDEFLVTIHPLVLGAGRRLFPAEGRRIPLRLMDMKSRRRQESSSPTTSWRRFLTCSANAWPRSLSVAEAAPITGCLGHPRG
jgi:dihydrofolate reductase